MSTQISRYFKITDDVAAGVKPAEALPDHVRELVGCEGSCLVPFDEVIESLRRETYACKNDGKSSLPKRVVKAIYYALRPMLSVSMRKHLQRRALKGWDEIEFPRWPVDVTVDDLMKQALKSSFGDSQEIPFIWFWPEGRSCSLILTHDVETAAGRDFCETLMDINESYGFKSAFQIVPEQRYEVPESFLNRIRERGFEVNIHGLNHDGKLFSSQELFASRAEKINEYGRKFGAKGFRSPVLYRNADWMPKLDFEYDMSFPNVGHLDPQRGGCCTVMPYFIENIVELPLTTMQDYSLFNILGSYSIDTWKEQIDLIAAHNGLISFNIHPDYLQDKKAMETYISLLVYLKDYVAANDVWAALPGEVADWWRMRDGLELKSISGKYEIIGKGSDKAMLAFARIADGELALRLGRNI